MAAKVEFLVVRVSVAIITMQEDQQPAPAQKHLADLNGTMTVRLKLFEAIE